MMNAVHQHHIRKHATQHFKHMHGFLRNPPVVLYGSMFVSYKYNSACQVYDDQVNEKYCINFHAFYFLVSIAILQLWYKLYPGCFLGYGHESTFVLGIVLNRCCTLNPKITNFKLFKLINADMSSTISGYSPTAVIPVAKCWCLKTRNTEP